MSGNQEISQVCSLEQLVLHKIAKKLWQDFLFRDIDSILGPTNYFFNINSLNPYQKKIINALPEVLPIGVHKLLRDKLIDAVFNLKFGYYDAIEWAYMHRNTLPFSVFHPNAGLYKAICFINPFDHFEDLSWVKLFVVDETQPIWSRFVFACFYCIEEMIFSLWYEMKKNNQLPYEGNLEKIRDEFGHCIGHWAYRLEDEVVAEIFVIGFYVDGFKMAVDNNLEYAARFFWSHCSAGEKEYLLSTFAIDLSYFCFRASPNVRLMFFLFSLLFVEHKNSVLISWITYDRSAGEVLTRLLCSYFHKVILNLLLPVLDSIPSNCLEDILSSLSFSISHVPTPANKKVFEILWNHLSQKQPDKILTFTNLFFKLIEINDIDLLEIVILPLPHSLKKEILESDVGIEAFHEVFLDGDCHTNLCGLLLFFLKYNPIKQQLKLKVNAINILDRFISNFMSFQWFAILRKSDIKMYSQMFQHFRETLPIIDRLVNHMEGEIINYSEYYRDFLSKKIYPLLSVKGKKINDKMEENEEIEYCLAIEFLKSVYSKMHEENEC